MSSDLAYWNFEVLSANINKDFVKKYPVALLRKQQMEASLLKAQDAFEERVLTQYKIDPALAIQTLTEYSNQQANRSYLQTVALLRELNIPFPTPETKAIKIRDEVPAEHSGS